MISCVKYGTCKQCAGIKIYGGYRSVGSEPLLATDICLSCHYSNIRNEEILIETKNNRELQEIDYICKFYEQRRD